MKLVGSNLDLRKVSWKKRVDVIPSRLSTDTEMSSDEVPGHSHTPLPGEEHHQPHSQSERAVCLLLIRHWLAAKTELSGFTSFSPSGPSASAHRILVASTAANLVDDPGPAFLCPLSIAVERW